MTNSDSTEAGPWPCTPAAATKPTVPTVNPAATAVIASTRLPKFMLIPLVEW